ncbi:GGDEF domain-containing protein [Lentibacter algarum]|uniref:GGDEF domain-containing protein n=2 Tax=Lentibacter algarum TaxID=576131 RepID=UPI00249046FF|nr:GGDEF domain-containing protein [Lentibacter algarum]
MTETDYLYTRAEAPDLHVLNFKATRLWFAALALVFVNYGLLTNVLGWTFYWQPAGDSAATTVVTALSISIGAIVFFLRQNSLQIQLGYILTFLALGLAISTRALELFPANVGWALEGEMGWNTLAVIVLLSLAGLLRRRAYNVATVSTLVSMVFIFNAIIGQSFGLRLIGGEMSFATTGALLFLTLATATLFTGFKPTRVFFLNSEIGQATRSLAFVSMVAPLACGLLLHKVLLDADQKLPIEAHLISIIIWAGLLNAMRAGNRLEKADALRRAAEERLERIATHDPLTGCLNRAGLEQAQCRTPADTETDESWAIGVFDLDHFKRINDTYGHRIGDRVLQEVRPALSRVMRPDERITRWGGEEFVLCLRYSDLKVLEMRVEEMRLALASIPERLETAGKLTPRSVTASVGVCLYEASQGFAETLAKADDALFTAKKTGRDRVVFFNDIVRGTAASRPCQHTSNLPQKPATSEMQQRDIWLTDMRIASHRD